MMFWEVPTYRVSWEGGEFRVPETNLETFLQVLVFNHVAPFRVEVAPGLVQEQRASAGSGSDDG